MAVQEGSRRPMDIAKYVGGFTVLMGIAENAAAGAILLCGPRTHVYIEGLSAWPDKDLRAAVEVSGTLTEGVSAPALSATSLDNRLRRRYVLTDPVWKHIS